MDEWTVVSDPVETIKMAMDVEDVHIAQLADKLGCTRQNISHLLNKDGGIRFDTFERTMAALGYEIIVKKNS